MSRAWWIRMSIIIVAILWSFYVLTPTFMAQSSRDKLTAQANAAQDAADKKKKEKDDRLQEAEHLPLSMKNSILSEMRNCRQSCKNFDEDPQKHGWVSTYLNGDGINALELCAQKQVPPEKTEGCALDSLKECTKICTAEQVGQHSEQECASACLQHNSENPMAPEWALKYYLGTEEGKFLDGTAKTFYSSCIETASKDFLETEKCQSQMVGACVSSCRESGEEVLSMKNQAIVNVYPKTKLSLGLDLQGGIDMDLEVEIEEAILSALQRDIASIRQASQIKGIALDDIYRATGEAMLLISVEEGVTLGGLQEFMTGRFSEYTYSDTREERDRTYYGFVLTDEATKEISDRSIEQALETLRSRIDETGVKEPSIVLKGGNRINIQLPGIDDIEQAMNAIGTSAVLEFMMVDEKMMNKSRDIVSALLTAEKDLSSEEYNNDRVLSDYMLRNGYLPIGDTPDLQGNVDEEDRTPRRLLWEYKSTPDGKERTDFVVVKDAVELTGDDINDARVSINQELSEPYVAIEFKPRGAVKFEDITGANVGNRFAIILDREVKSTPVIRERIGGGRASIDMGTGDFQAAMSDASVLSLVLRTGALPAPVSIGKVRTVGSSLGDDAIESGKNATMVGFGLVLLLMLFLYKKTGIVSVIALLVNILMVFALLSTVGATLTLPGIAGIALTIGMAVDCNIIIYERIREEIATGKDHRNAIGAGFDKALLAVVDANITTFIAGVVLYTYGTGPIKGFAVTLMIGIMTTLFTGVFLSRTLMDFLSKRSGIRLSI